jgi:NDP-sugar pyrophosphorylase family protein
LPIVDEDDHLIGVITDGDIRRAILNNNTELRSVINTDPYTVGPEVNKLQAISLLKSIHRRHLPIVDENKVLLGVISMDDFDFNLKKNKVVIMAGGLGTRLGDITKEIPKPMLVLGGRPLLESLILSFIDHGFNDFLISVNYRAEQIMNYFRNGEKFGASIEYLQEDKPLGTAGALSLIDEGIEDPFFVINGDILTSIDFGELLNFHIEKGAFGTMCVKEHEYQVPYATVVTQDSKLLDMKEKPTETFLVNTGIYLLNPEALQLVPKNEFYDMPTLIQEAGNRNKEIFTYNFSDFWLDIGQIKDYEVAKKSLSQFRI